MKFILIFALSIISFANEMTNSKYTLAADGKKIFKPITKIINAEKNLQVVSASEPIFILSVKSKKISALVESEPIEK